MSTIKVDAFQTTGGAELSPMRGWVAYNGTAASIRDDGNVSSVTDIGTGITRMIHDTYMSDANYCMLVACTDDGTTSGQTNGYAYGCWQRSSGAVYLATSYCQIGVGYPANSSYYDQTHINIAVTK